jgi:hypothetical protein
MTNSEIAALAEKVKLGNVWWHDGEGTIKQVREINLVEPVARLSDGTTIALTNARVTAFVTLQPAVRPGT